MATKKKTYCILIVSSSLNISLGSSGKYSSLPELTYNGNASYEFMICKPVIFNLFFQSYENFSLIL